jgi:vacuolar-type H+-ATPase subunit F/Vma7
MKSINKLFVVLIVFSCLQLWGCQNNEEEHETEHPAIVEDIEGTEFSTITLTEKAIERIGLKTSTVIGRHNSPLILVVPYSAIIYDQSGQTWVYTSPKPRTFVRQKIDVDYIIGDDVFLKEGPPEGTVIAIVGVTELYGSEFNVGH